MSLQHIWEDWMWKTVGKTNFPHKIDEKCLVFHGIPDIIIHKKKGEKKEGVALANYDGENEEEVWGE